MSMRPFPLKLRDKTLNGFTMLEKISAKNWIERMLSETLSNMSILRVLYSRGSSLTQIDYMDLATLV